MWFHLDGATRYSTSTSRGILQDKFAMNLVLRLSDFSWIGRSCELTPLDIFLWGSVKDRVYANIPQTLDQQQASICDAYECRNIVANVPISCRKLVQND